MPEEAKTERTWVRSADFCTAAQDLRARGYSRKQIREKLKGQFDLPGAVCLATIDKALKDGPIKIFPKSQTQV